MSRYSSTDEIHCVCGYEGNAILVRVGDGSDEIDCPLCGNYVEAVEPEEDDEDDEDEGPELRVVPS
jgi:hypothetical protein